MALDFQNLPLVFTQGVDTKSDPKAIPAGKLATLENAVFTRPGILSKRYGYDRLPRTIQGGASSIAAARAITAFGDELILYTGARAYSWAEGTMAWQDRGAVVSIATSAVPVIHNSYQQSNPDSAILNGVRVTAWEDSRGGIRCSVQDVETGTFHLADVSVSTTGAKPRVVAFGTDFAIFYTGTAATSTAFKLYYRRIVAANPTSLGTQTNPIATLVNTDAANNYDVLTVGGRLFVAWNDSGTTTARLAYFDASYALSAPVAFSIAATNCIGLTSATSTSNVTVFAADATRLRAATWTYNLTVASAFATVEATANVARVCGVLPDGSTTLTVLYEIHPTDGSGNPLPASGDDKRYVRTNTIDTLTNTPGTAADFKRSVGLASKIVQHNGTGYVMLVHAGLSDTINRLQETYFFTSIAGDIVGRVAQNNAGGLRSSSTLPDVATVSSGVVEVAGSTKGRVVSTAGRLYGLRGVTVSRLDFTDAQTFQSAKLGNNLVTAGGVVQAYDGLQFNEAGFHLYPEQVTADASEMTFNVTTTGAGGVAEVTDIACIAGVRITGGQYFTLSSTAVNYYVWFTVDAVGTDPAPAGKTGIAVAVLSTDTATQVAVKVAAALDALAAFVTTSALAVVTNTNAVTGAVTHAANAARPAGVGTGYLTVSKTYQYVAIYETTDTYGQITRSAGSIPVTVVTSSTCTSVTLTVPTLRLSGRSTAVRVVLYRTQAGKPSVFYRLNPLATPLLNSTTTDSVTYLDTQADADTAASAGVTSIATNETLYTTGNVIDAIAPPAATLVTTYRNRIVLSGHADPNLISYSTITAPDEAVYFAPEFSITVDARGGAITALGVLDDKLIIFKETAIYVLSGSGPDATGQQNDFRDPELIASDVGCNNANSVVQTAIGLMFQSPKGLYLLDRSLSVQYLGQDVEAHNATLVSGAVMVPNTNQVRFTTATGSALVYDYLFQQWSTFTNHESVDCDVWRGEFVFVRADGTVCVEDRTSFTDDGGDRYIKLRIETAWIQTAGIMGFQRAQWVYVLGDYRGPHKLRVKVAYDYDPIYVEDDTKDPGTLIGGATFGSGSPFGWASSSVPGTFGGATEPYEFGLHLRRQKCMAFRVSIEDVQASEYNEGVAINGVTLKVGIKRGLHKIPATKRA